MDSLIYLTQASLPLMADALLQSTLLLGFVLIVYGIVRRHSSARKHALLLAGMIGIPVLFFIVAVTPLRWQLPGTSDQTISPINGSAPPQITPLPVTQPQKISIPQAPSISTDLIKEEPIHATQKQTVSPPQQFLQDATTQWNWIAIVPIVWFAGSVLCLIRLIIAWLSLRVASRRFKPVTDGIVFDSFRNLFERESRIP